MTPEGDFLLRRFSFGNAVNIRVFGQTAGPEPENCHKKPGKAIVKYQYRCFRARRDMKKIVFKFNKKQHILAVATGFFAALPVLCLPIGLREGMTPAMAVSHAYEAVFGKENNEDGEVVIEDWALVGDKNELISADSDYDIDDPGAVDPGEPPEPGEEPDSTKSTEVNGTLSYSDIPAFVVYQKYDNSNLPVELLDPEFFTEDNSVQYVRASQSILKKTPDMASTTITSLHVGQQLTRVGIGDTWSKVVTEKGAEGYVLTESIQDTMVTVKVDRVVWVDTGSLIIRKEPSASSEQIGIVNQDARLYASAIVGDKWYKVKTSSGKVGYVYKSYTTSMAPPTPTPTNTPKPKNTSNNSSSSKSSSSKTTTKYGNTKRLPKITGKNGQSIVNIAKSMLGVKYKFAGASSKGIDCSGLVMYCYAQVGVSVPHGATQIWKRSGVSVPRSQIKVGDVICYDYGSYCGHVAIYVGNGQVIHASSTRGKVCYGNLDMMKIKAIKRIIQ